MRYALAIVAVLSASVAAYLLWREYKRRKLMTYQIESYGRARPPLMMTETSSAPRTVIDPIDPALIDGEFGESALGIRGYLG